MRNVSRVGLMQHDVTCWNVGIEFCPAVFQMQSYRTAHDLNLCYHMLPAFCMLSVCCHCLEPRQHSVVTSWMIQVFNATRNKRFLCSPNHSHQHWHLSSIMLSMCQRSMEVEWPRDHWPFGAKVKKNKCVLHGTRRDNINFTVAMDTQMLTPHM